LSGIGRQWAGPFQQQSGKPFDTVVCYLPAKRAFFAAFELVCTGGLVLVPAPVSMEDEVRFPFPFHYVSHA
jgi:hypothetical protein